MFCTEIAPYGYIAQRSSLDSESCVGGVSSWVMMVHGFVNDAAGFRTFNFNVGGMTGVGS